MGAGDAFGLSFYLYRQDAVTVVGHTGEQSGFRSFVYLNPGTGVGVIGVLNTVNAAHADRSNAGWSDLTRQAAELVAP